MNVAALWRFPCKSTLGEQLDEVEVTERGVVGDRAYALIGPDDGKVVSAKNPRKWGRVLELSAAYLAPPTPTTTPPIAVGFPDGTIITSDDTAIDDELTRFLGRPVRLTALAPEQRTMEETWPAGVDGLAPESFIAATRIATDDATETVSDIAMGLAAPPGTFFDLATLHLLTTATLERLAKLHPEGDFDVRRYRPNVLVDIGPDGEDAFVENDWVGHAVELGNDGIAMNVTLPTMRCIMTTLAQPTLGLERDPSLLLTIARNNRIEIGGGQWACAGVYGDAVGRGTVRVGDPVTVAAVTRP
jgi:uncharacterized protein YcbX